MADWYEVTVDGDTQYIRASNTRTAFDKGFTTHNGRELKLKPGHSMTIRVLRLCGGTEKVKQLEKFYQEHIAKRKAKHVNAGTDHPAPVV
jgi:hypothetical protein